MSSVKQNKKKQNKKQIKKFTVVKEIVKRQRVGPSRLKPILNSRHKPVDIYDDEFVADLTFDAGHDTQINLAFPVNPGQPLTFPLGSIEAKIYTEYVVKNVEFYYKPRVSEFNPCGSGGSVNFAFVANPEIPPLASKQQMEDAESHCDTLPCHAMRLKLKPSDCNRDGHLVRAIDVATPPTLTTYDAGTLYVKSFGIGADTSLGSVLVGELRVKYHFSLSHPRLVETGAEGLQYIHLTTTSPSLAPQTNPFTTMLIDSRENLNATVTSGNSFKITGAVPGNIYEVDAFANATTGTAVPTSAPETFAYTGAAGWTAFPVLENDTVTSFDLFETSNREGSNSTFVQATSTEMDFVSDPAIGWGQGFVSVLGDIICTGLGSVFSFSKARRKLLILKLSKRGYINATPRVRMDPFAVLEERIAHLTALVHSRPADSDFDEEEKFSAPRLTTSPSHLSRSTLDIIGEIVSRKSNSIKK